MYPGEGLAVRRDLYPGEPWRLEEICIQVSPGG